VNRDDHLIYESFFQKGLNRDNLIPGKSVVVLVKNFWLYSRYQSIGHIVPVFLQGEICIFIDTIFNHETSQYDIYKVEYNDAWFPVPDYLVDREKTKEANTKYNDPKDSIIAADLLDI
jgi:hypothetical protein